MLLLILVLKAATQCSLVITNVSEKCIASIFRADYTTSQPSRPQPIIEFDVSEERITSIFRIDYTAS